MGRGRTRRGAHEHQCHQLYEALSLIDWYLDHCVLNALRAERDAIWKELCFLGNIDFRTFTMEEKDLEFRNRIGAARYPAEQLQQACDAGERAAG